MSESEIQKLISIFLGLAIIVSSAVFVFSDNLVNSYKSNYEVSLNNSSQNNSGSSDVKNAFVESVKDLPPSYSTISLNDEFQPSGNLTDDFASYAAREIVKANPNGPEIDESGNQNIAIPDIEILTTNFATSTLSKINLPNWDEEVNSEINSIKIKTTDNTADMINSYFNTFNEIVNKNLLSKNIDDLNLDKNNTEIIGEALKTQVHETINGLKNVNVPINLINFHKQFLTVLIYQKKLLESTQKLKTDPLYAYYITNFNENGLLKNLSLLDKESEKLNLLKPTSKINNSIIFFWNLKPKVAMAQVEVPVADWALRAKTAAIATTQTKSLTQKMLEWLRKIATEILKDQLIHRLVQQTIRWVQGGGKPQFITNWQQFLSDAASAGAGRALSEIYPRICQPFKIPIQIAFQGQSANIYENQIACTLGNMVNNLKEFYNNFKYGGWIAYGQVLNPQNNLWGSLIIANDIIIQKGSEKKESEQNDAQASKGFLSMKKCVKEKKWSLEKKIALTMPQLPDTKMRCGPVDEPGLSIAANACLITKCEQYENTTPGGLAADITSQAIANSPISRIVNAQDIAALASALVNSGLNKLILAGQKGLMSLFTGKSGGGGDGTSPNQNTVTDPNDPCFGEIIGSESYNDCRSITEGGGLYKTDTGQQQITLLQQARSVLKQLQDNVSSDNEWLSTASSTQIGLQKIGGCSNQEIQTSTTTTQTIALCPNLATEACNLNNKIEELKIKTTAELSILQQSIQNIEAIITELSDSKELTIQRLNEINQELSRYNDPSINAPAQRLSKLKELKSAVNENISGSQQCQTPLPQL